MKKNSFDHILDELHSRFGNELEIVSLQGKRFYVDEDQAVFLLKGAADLFFAEQDAGGDLGFSLSLFPRMEAGTLIPPMTKSEKIRYYGRCLPDSELVMLPWKKVKECGIDKDPFLWNALSGFAMTAHWDPLPADLSKLMARISDWCENSAKKLEAVNLQNLELIRNNTQEQQRQHKHIFAAFSALLQSRKNKAGMCNPDDPMAAAAMLTAEKSGIHDFTLCEGRNPEHRIERSAESNHLRITPAHLGDNWYKMSFLPMMLISEDGATAYCAYHSAHGDPVAWDGKDGKLYCIDRNFSETLEPTGWNIVLPLPPAPVTPKKLFHFYFRAFQDKILWVVLLVLASTFLDMGTPVINSMIFSDVVPNSDRTLLGQLFFLLLVASLAGVVLTSMTRNILRCSNDATEFSMQMALFDRVMRLPVDFFRKYPPAEMGMRAIGVQSLFSMLNVNCYLSMINLCFVIFPMGMLFYYSAKMAAAMLAILLLIIGMALLFSIHISKLQYTILVKNGETNGLLERFLANVGKLHAAGAENHALLTWIKKFSDKQTLENKSKACMIIIKVCFAGLSWLIFCVTMGVILLMYMNNDGADKISLSDFSGFISASGLVSSTLMGALSSVSAILQIGPIFKWLMPLLETPAEGEEKAEGDKTVSDSDDEEAEYEVQGGIELDNVSFSYDSSRQILKNVSIKADPGEFIAITGESGAGKSTLLRLMLRFEKPSSGTILYDGNDVDTKNMSHIRSRLGVVLQNASLLPMSILQNIIGTTSRYTEEDAWRAAEMAGCAEDIRQFPMQMHTFVSGGVISGGQQQRLLLAHALIREPRLIFLDEATSALDNRTQRIIIESLKKVKATKVVIAHRLSTIIDADRIYVLEKGSVVEVGTYRELMNKKGVFSNMAARQIVEEKGE